MSMGTTPTATEATTREVREASYRIAVRAFVLCFLVTLLAGFINFFLIKMKGMN